MPSFLKGLTAALALAMLAACGKGGDSALEVAFIGSEDGVLAKGVRLSSAAQHVRAATATGLVGLDEEGQVVPALADRWIVTDGGRSYIFRLRDLNWPSGAELTAEDVRNGLRRLRRDLAGTTLGADLAQISDIKAMTGKVVEIRLANPMPDFLQLLAQPELGLLRNGRGFGPMTIERDNPGFVLNMLPPEARGLPQDEDWEEAVRPLRLHVLAARAAIEMFDAGQADLVLGGALPSLPMVETGPLSRGTVRMDPAIGLFGLRVMRPEGFLANPAGREAISLAIDRDSLLAPFNVGGWVATTRIVSPDLPGQTDSAPERWADTSFEQRQAEAARRVAEWERSSGEKVFVRIAMPEGPGAVTLFRQIASDLGAVGIASGSVRMGETADLRLVDLVARYGEPQWFLDQFHCGLRSGLCSSDVDRLIARAQASEDPAEAAMLLAQAEAQLTALEAFIPFGHPIRWSLVRGDVNGFAVNRWGFHPLPPLATVPR